MQLIELVNGQWQAVEQNLPEWESASACLLAVDAEPTSMDESMLNVGIELPAFIDGRALSLAVLLRTRLGFSGDLYAIGSVHEDILHYLARCGFNKIVVPEGCPVEQALALIQPYSQYYQSSVTEQTPSFRRVERG